MKQTPPDALPASKEAEAVAKMHRRAQIAEGWLVSLRSLASAWENGPEPKSDNQFKEFWSGWKAAAKHLREQVEQITAKNEAKLSAHPPTDAGVSEALADAIVNFVTDWAAEDDEDTMRRDLEQMFKRFAALSIPAGDGVKGEEAERIKGLEDFQKEVMGWLRERGLVDFRDDEWDGFTSVIEEHEAEIEAAAIRETTRALSTASTAGKG